MYFLLNARLSTGPLRYPNAIRVYQRKILNQKMEAEVGIEPAYTELQSAA